MEQIGTVTENKGGVLVVRVDRTSACGENCGNNCEACGEKRRVLVRARNDADAQVGDQVVLESNTRRVLLFAFLVYLLPIIMLAAGYWLGDWAGLPEMGSVLLAFALFAASFLPALLANRREEKRGTVTVAVRLASRAGTEHRED